MTTLLAIDPGTHESGWCEIRDGRVVDSGVSANEDLARWVEAAAFARAQLGGDGACAIEMIASYGMPVGAEVFETCVWIGRFDAAWHRHTDEYPTHVYRRDVKLHLCGSPRAKDPNVRQALLDLLGPQGTKKAPGPTYGVKSHAWAALAVGATHLQLRRDRAPTGATP